MQKLVENIRVSGASVKQIPLTESRVRVNESDVPVSSAFRVPIWRLDEQNLNKRTYSTKVAEKVVKENKTTVALADHPEDEGSVWDIVAVAKNPKIENGILWAEAYFVDDAMAKKVDKIVEHGGEIGLSSSAYGEVDDSGNVLEEGFEVDRYFDLVLEPSYQVFIDPKTPRLNAEDSSNPQRTESTDRTTKPKDSNLTIESEGLSKESKMKSYDNLQEANFRMNIKSMITEADNKGSLVEKRDALQEVLSYVDSEIASDLYEQVSNQLETVETEIRTLAEKGEQVDDLESRASEAETKATSLEEQIQNQKQLYESKIASLQKKYEKANEVVEELRESVKTAKEETLWETGRKNARVSAQAYVDLLTSFKEIKEELAAAQQKLKEQKTEKRVHEPKKEESQEKPLRRPSGRKRPTDEARKEAHRKAQEKLREKVKGEEAEKVVEPETQDDGFDLSFDNKDEVRDYFNERVAEDPRYKQYEEEILGCKTLEEAQIKAMHVDLDAVPVRENSTKVAESTRQKSKSTDEEQFMTRLRRKGWV